MKTITCLLLLIGFSLSLGSMTTSAQEPTKNEILAGQLLDILRLEKLMDTTFDAMPKMQQQLLSAQKMSPDQQEAVTKQMQSSMEVVKKELGWETIKPLFVKIYADTYDEHELQGLIDFYKTPVGQTWIDKQPAIQAATMQAMTQIMPRIQAAMMEAMKKAVPPDKAAAKPTP